MVKAVAVRLTYLMMKPMMTAVKADPTEQTSTVKAVWAVLNGITSPYLHKAPRGQTVTVRHAQPVEALPWALPLHGSRYGTARAVADTQGHAY